MDAGGITKEEAIISAQGAEEAAATIRVEEADSDRDMTTMERADTVTYLTTNNCSSGIIPNEITI